MLLSRITEVPCYAAAQLDQGGYSYDPSNDGVPLHDFGQVQILPRRRRASLSDVSEHRADAPFAWQATAIGASPDGLPGRP